MNLIPRWTWLQAIRRTAPVDRRDAADMGTAFGLDASFDHVPPRPGTPPASPAPWRSALTGLPRRP
jgi:hypothetical protein